MMMSSRQSEAGRSLDMWEPPQRVRDASDPRPGGRGKASVGEATNREVGRDGRRHWPGGWPGALSFHWEVDRMTAG